MYIDDGSWTNIRPSEIIKALRLSTALKLSWNSYTAHPVDKEKWTKNNPSVGQCAVTSCVVQDYLNGVIHTNSEFHHYWNQLPSGAFVDFTHDQFGIDNPIVSQGKTEKKHLLKGEKAEQALTKERYHALKKEVKENIKNLAPTVLLLSSNAQPEYIHDIIETMGTPRGTIHHFRYMLRYVDNALRKLIPVKGQKGSNYLIDMESTIIYLNQKRISSRVYSWNNSIPIRMAVIRECYKTGEADNSIAHFFFEVRESLLKTDLYDNNLREIFGKSFEKAYAYLTFEDTKNLIERQPSSEIFEKQCDILRDIGLSFETEDKKIEYEPPLLILFEGLYKKRNWRKAEKLMKPKYDASGPNSYYKLKEGESYLYKFRTYSWEFRNPYEIDLKVSKQLFNTPEKYSLVVKSAYDSECWELITSFVEQNTIGSMELDIKHIEIIDEKQPQQLEINWIISTLLSLKRRLLPRLLDVISDLLFALGPVYIAATKMFDKTPKKPVLIESWPEVLIGIYSIWFMVKLVRRVISG